jgi:hypothetical protein
MHIWIICCFSCLLRVYSLYPSRNIVMVFVVVVFIFLLEDIYCIVSSNIPSYQVCHTRVSILYASIFLAQRVYHTPHYLYTLYVLVDVHNSRIPPTPPSFNSETDFVYIAFLTKAPSKVNDCLVQHVGRHVTVGQMV